MLANGFYDYTSPPLPRAQAAASVSTEVYLLGWKCEENGDIFSRGLLPCWAVADSNLTRRERRTPSHHPPFEGRKSGQMVPLTSSEKILTRRKEEQNES